MVWRMLVGDLQVAERKVIPPATVPQANDDAIEIVYVHDTPNGHPIPYPQGTPALVFGNLRFKGKDQAVSQMLFPGFQNCHFVVWVYSSQDLADAVALFAQVDPGILFGKFLNDLINPFGMNI